MVVCPGYTETEIVPDGQQESAPPQITYKEEWMVEFFKELEYYKPPQK
jgi:hypothetical protein